MENNLSIKKIDHLGIAVHNLEESVHFFKDVLGLELLGTEQVDTEGVKVAFFKVGEVKIELLEPLSTSSPIHKHLEKKGEGFHHLAFLVDSLVNTFNQMKDKDIQLLQEEPRKGAHEKLVGFIHPKDSHKVLIEFCQHSEDKE